MKIINDFGFAIGFVIFLLGYLSYHGVDIQVLLILPFFIWVYFICRISINNNSFKKILIPIIFVTLYVFPFLIINSTPRYRMPILDVFFIVHVIYIYKNKNYFRVN